MDVSAHCAGGSGDWVKRVKRVKNFAGPFWGKAPPEFLMAIRDFVAGRRQRRLSCSNCKSDVRFEWDGRLKLGTESADVRPQAAQQSVRRVGGVRGVCAVRARRTWGVARKICTESAQTRRTRPLLEIVNTEF